MDLQRDGKRALDTGGNSGPGAASVRACLRFIDGGMTDYPAFTHGG